jgi:hypothetical protein
MFIKVESRKSVKKNLVKPCNILRDKVVSKKNIIFKQSSEVPLMKLYIEDLERGFLGLEREEMK